MRQPFDRPTPGELIRAMREFRERTLGLISDLDDEQLIGPQLAIVNPPLWEIGHVAWFQEFWVLRHLLKQRPLLENGDRLYNSTDVAHDTRWDLLLPSLDDTRRYLNEVIGRAIGAIESSAELSREQCYFYWLATFHESMHAEALAYTRQTLGYPAPNFVHDRVASQVAQGPAVGDVSIPGGIFIMGAARHFPFVFDNEKWEHPVEVKPFRIARTAVTNAQFREFVDDDGYRRPELWTPEGWDWLHSGRSPELERSFARFFNKSIDERRHGTEFTQQFDHPIYWRRRSDGRWEQRVFDRILPLREQLPVMHVSWYEAEAYCRWAGRRLPTEAEWELAASGEPLANGGELGPNKRHFPWGDGASAERANVDWVNAGAVDVEDYEAGDSAFGCRQMIGNVWEWTADTFLPYPGFAVDPYKEYSEPWFGTHKVLRGGCWATSSLLIRNTWRNFYTPDRRDVWAGFRTCAK